MGDSTASREDQPADETSGTPEPSGAPDSTEPVRASAGAPAPLPGQVFELRPPPPVRALAISSAAAVAGAIVIVVSNHPAVTALGAILLAFGVLLAAAALVLTARLRSTVSLDSSRLEVTRGRRQQSLSWGDIERVEQRSHELVALARPGERDLVVPVPGRRGPTYVRLLEALRVRLDASRGYGTLT